MALVQLAVLRNQLRSMASESSGPGHEGHSWVTFSIIQEIKLKTPITFDPGSSGLSEPARNALLHVARVLAEHPHLSLRVEGHTDLDETKLPFTVPPHLLSEERATKALRELDAVGVARHRLQMAGRAADCPVATNLTQFGRQTRTHRYGHPLRDSTVQAPCCSNPAHALEGARTAASSCI